MEVNFFGHSCVHYVYHVPEHLERLASHRSAQAGCLGRSVAKGEAKLRNREKSILVKVVLSEFGSH